MPPPLEPPPGVGDAVAEGVAVAVGEGVAMPLGAPAGAAQGRFSVAELLIALFIFVTAPVSANLLAQAALHRRERSVAPVPEDQPLP